MRAFYVHGNDPPHRRKLRDGGRRMAKLCRWRGLRGRKGGLGVWVDMRPMRLDRSL